ncbi:MAG: multicopper oxidase family protein, partial [Gemmatimonadales bacterium]|nr:multicopper oxidase family protein [Gemmatimonadales bacterium]
RLAMLAFNGQHPGPLIRVPEKSTIFVNFTNRTPYPTAVHWHGIRLDNAFDGVPGLTQDPVAPGESFRYRIYFRDAGIYWYHPHHREDVQQELGLYGNILVDPADADYYGPANREEVLILDDILLDDEGLVDFGEESANYALMGRFGNRPLVNGEPTYGLRVDRGEVVRFHLTNASNTRTFNLSFVDIERGLPDPDQRVADPDVADPHRLPMKVIASDVGRFEREEWTRSVVLAPAERYVIDVRFDGPGTHAIVNHVQGINHRQGVFRSELWTFGIVRVASQPAAQDHGATFEALREHADVIAEIDRFRPRFDDEPDRELVMTLETEDLPLPIERSMAYDWVYFNPVEWTGTMPRMNWATTGSEIRWILRETDTGRENEEIEWNFAVGDVVKIRVVNDRGAFHAMQHPLHIHGQRFLVLSQNGVPNDNLVWKDTVLLPAASTTDILLELSNPGRWMIHCHIAEHLEAGMKMTMNVADAPP